MTISANHVSFGGLPGRGQNVAADGFQFTSDIQNNVLIPNTSRIGIFAGTGVPTISAPQGSLYLRTDGSSTSTRLYIATNSTGTWTTVTTAA